MTPEIADAIRALAHDPQEAIVAFLRDRSIDVGTLHGAVYELPPAECLPLYRAVFELYPTLPDADEDEFSQPRTGYVVARFFAANAALELDDIPLALELLAPAIPLTSEFPFVARAAAWALLRSGRRAEAIDQVRVAGEAGGSSPDALETAPELADLHDEPAFQRIIHDLRERRITKMLRQWPASVPVPPRLLDLARFITGPGGGRLGDYDTDDLDDDYLAWIWADKEREAFTKDFERHPPAIAFFLRDGGGGQLGLWMHGEPSEWPVVAIDSEGSHEVRGENLDDFLCMASGADDTNAGGRLMPSSDEARAWVRSLGLTPHERPVDRFPALTRRTLEFERWCAEQRRSILARVFPARPLTVDAEPGVSVGRVRLGAPQAEVDAAIGAARFSESDDEDEPLMTAFYDATPFVIEYHRATRTVAEVSVYADWPLLRFPGGFEPLFATALEAERWLQDRGHPYSYDRGSLICPALGLTLSLICRPLRVDRDSGWVSGVQFRLPEQP